MSDGLDPKHRPVREFEGIKTLVPLAEIEDMRNRSVNHGDTTLVHWLCDSYATLLMALEKTDDHRG